MSNELSSLSGSEKISRLKKYFQKEPQVLLAFLFGSFAKGRAIKESDVDLAVYLSGKSKQDRIWSKASQILEKEVDLICLNEAPATFLKTGIPLTSEVDLSRI